MISDFEAILVLTKRNLRGARFLLIPPCRFLAHPHSHTVADGSSFFPILENFSGSAVNWMYPSVTEFPTVSWNSFLRSLSSSSELLNKKSFIVWLCLNPSHHPILKYFVSGILDQRRRNSSIKSTLLFINIKPISSWPPNSTYLCNKKNKCISFFITTLKKFEGRKFSWWKRSIRSLSVWLKCEPFSLFFNILVKKKVREFLLNGAHLI